MRKLLLTLSILISSLSVAQDLYWPATLGEINTGANLTMLITLEEEIYFNGNPIADGAMIGIFYEDDEGVLQNAGFTSYLSGETMQFAAYGDDATTPETDGYASGQAYVWYINIDGNDYPTEATYFVGGPFTNVYQTNQLTRVTHFSIESSDDDIEGCTDSAYLEFNPEATIDDGSCETLIVEGCTDSNFLEYNENATEDDGTCLTPILVGCMDVEANNFNEDANVACDDCCETTIFGCTDPTAFNFNPLANEDDGSCTDEAIGCTDPDFVEYNPDANTDTDPSSCITPAIYGCTVEAAVNFDLEANVNDGSCIMVLEGCIDPLYLEYNEDATLDDGSCLVMVILGCTDINYVEFFPPANTDDGSCEVLVDGGCIDEGYIEFDPEATVDDGSCITLIVAGCMDEQYLEFNPLANTDDNSCTNVAFPGCTEPLADNFNPIANQNDGSCEYLGCTDETAFNYDDTSNLDDGSCVPVLEGCTNPNYLEFDLNANINDGSCITVIVYGCTDESALNFDPYANVDDDSCIPQVEGCMDTLYVEFSPLATVDDGTCETLIVTGCTDEDAANFDLYATIDDGSCIYYLIIVDYTHLGASTYEFEVEVVSMLGYTILWDFGDNSYSNAEEVIHVYEYNGTYTITITVTNGEMSLVDEITIIVNVPGLGIDEIEDVLVQESYFDVLGRPCVEVDEGVIYIRNREYSSGKRIRDKIFYQKH